LGWLGPRRAECLGRARVRYRDARLDVQHGQRLRRMKSAGWSAENTECAITSRLESQIPPARANLPRLWTTPADGGRPRSGRGRASVAPPDATSTELAGPGQATPSPQTRPASSLRPDARHGLAVISTSNSRRGGCGRVLVGGDARGLSRFGEVGGLRFVVVWRALLADGL
jgi:hypothetical protein